VLVLGFAPKTQNPKSPIPNPQSPNINNLIIKKQKIKIKN